MGSRQVVISQSIDIEVRATIVWPDPPAHGFLARDLDEDPREVDEFKGVSPADDILLGCALKHGLLSEDELYLQAIETHDDMCRYEREMDGYRLAARRMMSAARDIDAEADKLARSTTQDTAKQDRVVALREQARGIRAAHARVSDWRAAEERKARGVFREGLHEMEAALSGQDDADDAISEARLMVVLQTSDRVRKALGKEVLDERGA